MKAEAKLPKETKETHGKETGVQEEISMRTLLCSTVP